MEVAGADLACHLVLEAREELAHDAEARRHDAARRAGVHALVEHLDGQRAVDDPPKRGRHPELVVVAAAGVEAHDEARRADARRERVHVRRQVVAAAFLARLDQHDAPRVRGTRGLQRLDRGECGERRVRPVAHAVMHPHGGDVDAGRHLATLDPSVPGEGAAVVGGWPDVADADLRKRPGAVDEAHRPMGRPGEPEAGRAAPSPGQDDRRAARQPHDVETQAFDRALDAPVFEKGDGLIDVAVLPPLRVVVG